MKVKKLILNIVLIMLFLMTLNRNYVNNAGGFSNNIIQHNRNLTKISNVPKYEIEDFKNPSIIKNPSHDNSSDYTINYQNENPEYIDKNDTYILNVGFYVKADYFMSFTARNIYIVVDFIKNSTIIDSLRTSALGSMSISLSYNSTIKILNSVDQKISFTEIDKIKFTFMYSSSTFFDDIYLYGHVDLISQTKNKSTRIINVPESKFTESKQYIYFNRYFQTQIPFLYTEKAKIYYPLPYFDKKEWDNLSHENVVKNVVPKVKSGNVNLNSLKINNTFSKNTGNGTLTFKLQSTENNVAELNVTNLRANVIDLSGMLKLSKNNGKEWDWNNSKFNYYNLRKQPKITLFWNADFFKALNSNDSKPTLISNLQNLAKKFPNLNIQNSIAYVNNFSLNEYNYEHFESYVIQNNGQVPAINSIPKANWENKPYKKYVTSTRSWSNIVSYLLSDDNLIFKYKVTYIDSKGVVYQENIEFKSVISNEKLDLYIPDRFQKLDEYQLNWELNFENMEIYSPKLNMSFQTPIERDFTSSELNSIYGQKIEWNTNGFKWNVRYQIKSPKIEEGISIININTGEIMNEKFQVVKDKNGNNILNPGNKDDIDYGYKSAYIKLSNEMKSKFTIDLNTYDRLQITKRSGRWFAKHYNEIDIEKHLGELFDENEIIYLFSNQLHVVINTKSFITKIEKVYNSFDGKTDLLEDFLDNETSDWFDNVFGADLNSNLDPVGTINNEKNQVFVKYANLQTLVSATPKFEIDDKVLDVKVTGIGSNVQKMIFNKPDNQGEIKPFPIYVSNRPMAFYFSDPNLLKVSAEFIDSSGNWYEGQMNYFLNSFKNRATELVQNYQGIMRFKISDAAGNSQEIYSLLRINNKLDGIQQFVGVNSLSGEVIKSSEIDENYDLDMFGNGIKSIKINNNNPKKFYIIDNDPLLNEISVDKQITSNEWESISKSEQNGEAILSEFFKTKTENQKIPNSGEYPKNIFDLMGDNVKGTNNFPIVDYEPHLTSLSVFEIQAKTLYRITTKSNIMSNINTYYIYLYENDDIDFYREVVESLMEKDFEDVDMVIDATITKRMIEGRHQTIGLEKEQFYANYEYIHSQMHLNNHIQKYQLNILYDQIDNWTTVIDGIITEYEKYKNATEWVDEFFGNKIEIDKYIFTLKEWINLIEGNSLDLEIYNKAVEMVNALLKSDEYINSKRSIEFFEINSVVQLEFLRKSIDNIITQRNILSNVVDDNKRKYESKRNEWKSSLSLAGQEERVQYDKVRLINSSKYSNYFIPGFLLKNYKLSVTEVGYTLFSKGPNVYLPFENKFIGYLFKLSYYNTIKNKYEDINFIIHNDFLLKDDMEIKSSQGGYVFDGPLTFNGTELEDVDHLINRQGIFIESNPDLSVDDLWEEIKYPPNRVPPFDNEDYEYKEEEEELVESEKEKQDQDKNNGSSAEKEENDKNDSTSQRDNFYEKVKWGSILSGVVISTFGSAYVSFALIKRYKGAKIK